jgi:hypothetical protein
VNAHGSPSSSWHDTTAETLQTASVGAGTKAEGTEVAVCTGVSTGPGVIAGAIGIVGVPIDGDGRGSTSLVLGEEVIEGPALSVGDEDIVGVPAEGSVCVGGMGKGSTPLMVGDSVLSDVGTSPGTLVEGASVAMPVGGASTGVPRGELVVSIGSSVGVCIGNCVGVFDGGSDVSGEDTGADTGLFVGEEVIEGLDGSSENIGADVAGLGNGSTALVVGDAVKETDGKDGKTGPMDETGGEVSGADTAGEGVVCSGGTTGVWLGARLPVMNRLTSSSMHGIPLGTSAATTAVVSIIASRHTSIITSSRMTTISPGPKGFAVTISPVKSYETPFSTPIKPMTSTASTALRFITL